MRAKNEQEGQLPQIQRATNIALYYTVQKAFRYVEPFKGVRQC